MSREIAVGFGFAAVTRNGETVWQEDDRDEMVWQVKDAEKAARKAPRADWRIVLHAPLHGETYQRHGKGRWLLIEKNEGFA